MISLSASLGFGPPARRVKVGAHVRGETMAREARSETVATKRKRAEKRPRGGARARAFWRRHASIETEAAQGRPPFFTPRFLFTASAFRPSVSLGRCTYSERHPTRRCRRDITDGPGRYAWGASRRGGATNRPSPGGRGASRLAGEYASSLAARWCMVARPVRYDRRNKRKTFLPRAIFLTLISVITW